MALIAGIIAASHSMQKSQSWSTICTTSVTDHSMALIADIIIIIIESKILKADIHFRTTNVDHSTKTNQRLTKLRAKVLKSIFSMIIAIITITTKKSAPSQLQSRSSSHQIESKSLKIEPQLTNIGAALADLKPAA